MTSREMTPLIFVWKSNRRGLTLPLFTCAVVMVKQIQAEQNQARPPRLRDLTERALLSAGCPSHLILMLSFLLLFFRICSLELYVGSIQRVCWQHIFLFPVSFSPSCLPHPPPPPTRARFGMHALSSFGHRFCTLLRGSRSLIHAG